MIPKSDLNDLRREAKRLGAEHVLEFGPGFSTYAFLEAGCQVVTLEHSPYWHGKAQHRFKDDERVKIVPYMNLRVIYAPKVEGMRFDLAFVDSPQGVSKPGHVVHRGQEGLSRYNTMRFALEAAPVVLLHDANRRGERATLKKLVGAGYRVELIGKRIARVLQPVEAHAT